jgi:deazaflavin-dependent oxidoreductase (nitroreductase family)
VERHSVSDSDPNGGNRQVITEFRAHGGTVSGYFANMPLLLLTTTGAKSGQPRTSPLTYMLDGDRYVVFAGNAGAARHPDWYHNLLADPRVVVEVGANRLQAIALVITGAERAALFERYTADQPQLAFYQAQTTRQVPAIVLQVVP